MSQSSCPCPVSLSLCTIPCSPCPAPCALLPIPSCPRSASSHHAGAQLCLLFPPSLTIPAWKVHDFHLWQTEMSNLVSGGPGHFGDPLILKRLLCPLPTLSPTQAQGDLAGAAPPITICPIGWYLQVQHNPLSQAPDREVVDVEVEHHLGGSALVVYGRAACVCHLHKSCFYRTGNHQGKLKKLFSSQHSSKKRTFVDIYMVLCTLDVVLATYRKAS